MKTLLCTIAIIGLCVLPVLAAEEVKIDLSGSRVAAGYQDQGKNGEANPGSFTVPDAKLQATAKLAEDISAVIRLNFDNGVANGADLAYITVDNVGKKLAGDKTPVNPSISVGVFKMNFGEETFNNDPVNNALVENSVTNPSGIDAGVQIKQDDLVPSLPLILGATLGFFNGNNGAFGAGDTNNSKAWLFKASGTMKNMPLYFAISDYGSNDIPNVAGSTTALNIGQQTNPAVPGTSATWCRKVYQLDVRYDLLEGAAKFDPSKAPLWSDAKGVFRLAYGNCSDTGPAAGKPLTQAYIMIDCIFNVDKKWYVAFRYSYDDYAISGLTGGPLGKYTNMSIGGGHRLSENTILKLDLTTKAEPSTIKPKIENDSINLILSTKW